MTSDVMTDGAPRSTIHQEPAALFVYATPAPLGLSHAVTPSLTREGPFAELGVELWLATPCSARFGIVCISRRPPATTE
jgi:hypothetical protein